ncbi:hypothetical protein [Nonomuraea sp. NPDC049480]|uniref:hypothetical protein n=1 Tax=Nonomuraea sp. NPDC049480 TaxID=3364353 RepID=UPI0037A9BC2E
MGPAGDQDQTPDQLGALGGDRDRDGGAEREADEIRRALERGRDLPGEQVQRELAARVTVWPLPA